MKQEIKDELHRSFEAPAPLGKREFFRKLNPPQMSIWEFTLSQAGYIRKWAWGISAAVFAVSLFAVGMFPAHMLWILSALTPLLALTVLAECGRSESHEMAELEMATRFSLRSVIIARLGILGGENLLLLFLMIPMSIHHNTVNPIASGLYILTPYLLTAFTGLHIVRRFRGREGIYLCMTVSLCISLSVSFFHGPLLPLLFGEQFPWWVLLILFLCGGTVRQAYQFINRMEELT